MDWTTHGIPVVFLHKKKPRKPSNLNNFNMSLVYLTLALSRQTRAMRCPCSKHISYIMIVFVLRPLSLPRNVQIFYTFWFCLVTGINHIPLLICLVTNARFQSRFFVRGMRCKLQCRSLLNQTAFMTSIER